MPTRGAISSQTSPLPSVILSYPPLTQDLVAPPKRVVAGLTAALQLGLRPFPYTCKQESGSTQLGGVIKWVFNPTEIYIFLIMKKWIGNYNDDDDDYEEETDKGIDMPDSYFDV